MKRSKIVNANITKSNNTTNFCDRCNLWFSSSITYQNHRKTHIANRYKNNKVNQKKCYYCGVSFKFYRNLSEHYYLRHMNKCKVDVAKINVKLNEVVIVKDSVTKPKARTIVRKKRKTRSAVDKLQEEARVLINRMSKSAKSPTKHSDARSFRSSTLLVRKAIQSARMSKVKKEGATNQPTNAGGTSKLTKLAKGRRKSADDSATYFKTEEQIGVLKQYYSRDKWPTIGRLAHIAKKTKLTKDIVNKWFAKARFVENTGSSGSVKKSKKRSKKSKEQLEILNSYFKRDKWPSEEVMKRIAKKTSLTTEKIKEWFFSKRRNNHISAENDTENEIIGQPSARGRKKKSLGSLDTGSKLSKSRLSSKVKTPRQLHILNSQFEINSFPTKDRIKELSHSTGISVPKIYSWFMVHRRSHSHEIVGQPSVRGRKKKSVDSIERSSSVFSSSTFEENPSLGSSSPSVEIDVAEDSYKIGLNIKEEPSTEIPSTPTDSQSTDKTTVNSQPQAQQQGQCSYIPVIPMQTPQGIQYVPIQPGMVVPVLNSDGSIVNMPQDQIPQCDSVLTNNPSASINKASVIAPEEDDDIDVKIHKYPGYVSAHSNDSRTAFSINQSMKDIWAPESQEVFQQNVSQGQSDQQYGNRLQLQCLPPEFQQQPATQTQLQPDQQHPLEQLSYPMYSQEQLQEAALQHQLQQQHSQYVLQQETAKQYAAPPTALSYTPQQLQPDSPLRSLQRMIGQQPPRPEPQYPHQVIQESPLPTLTLHPPQYAQCQPQQMQPCVPQQQQVRLTHYYDQQQQQLYKKPIQNQINVNIHSSHAHIPQPQPTHTNYLHGSRNDSTYSQFQLCQEESRVSNDLVVTKVLQKCPSSPRSQHAIASGIHRAAYSDTASNGQHLYDSEGMKIRLRAQSMIQPTRPGMRPLMQRQQVGNPVLEHTTKVIVSNPQSARGKQLCQKQAPPMTRQPFRSAPTTGFETLYSFNQIMPKIGCDMSSNIRPTHVQNVVIDRTMPPAYQPRALTPQSDNDTVSLNSSDDEPVILEDEPQARESSAEFMITENADWDSETIPLIEID